MALEIDFTVNAFCGCDAIIGVENVTIESAVDLNVVIKDLSGNVVQGPVRINGGDEFIFRNLCAGTYRVCGTPVTGGTEVCLEPITLTGPVVDEAHFLITSTPSNCKCNGSVTITNNAAVPIFGYVIRADQGIDNLLAFTLTLGVNFASISFTLGAVLAAASLHHFHLPAGNTDTLDNLCPGEYAVLLDDVNVHLLGALRCRRNFIVESNAPVINVDILKDPCEGKCEATVVITAHSGFPFLDANKNVLGYLYDDGLGNFSTTPTLSRTITGLCAGCHTYSVKDANGCVTTDDCHIEAIECPNYLNFNAKVKDSCPCQATGSVTLQGVGNANTPFEYSRDNVTYSTNNVFTDLEPGVYVFFVRDSTGAVFSKDVIVGEKQGPVVISVCVTPVVESCDGKVLSLGSIYVEAENGGCKLTYLLRKQQCLQVNPCFDKAQLNHDDFDAYDCSTIENLAAGEYQLVVVDANCCRTEVRHIKVPAKRQKCTCPTV